MNPQDYLQIKLGELKEPTPALPPVTPDDLVEQIFKLVMSKKFRKYAATEALIEHVKNAIRLNVEKHEPINITFFHGAYKLWRLEESPEVDWAELFALMYYTRWVKPVCAIYPPGVWFDFFVDDLIVPKLDNVPIADIHAYIQGYQALMDFLRPYQPANLRMTITPVGSRFASEEAFDESLRLNVEKLTASTPGGLPVLDYAARAMVELNTKVTPEQAEDPLWREKVYHLHNAYMATKAEPGYHKNRPDKILAFTQPLPGGTMLSVGTTKDSIAKFWVGVGALKPAGESYRQMILPPSQLATASFKFQPVKIAGLPGTNFHRIRVLAVQ